MTSPACHFSIQNSLFKNTFGHTITISHPIFKMFAAHFTTNLDLDIDKNSLRSAK